VAVLEVLEGLDVVDAQGDYFEVGHFLDQGQVLEVVAPEVQVLDPEEVVVARFCEDQLFCQGFYAGWVNRL